LAQVAVDPTGLPDETHVASAAARPAALEEGSRRVQVGDGPNRLLIREGNLVDAVEAGERDPLGQVQAESVKDPFQPGQVKQDVGPDVEREAADLETADEPARSVARLQ
jgi:hypothetical protein